MYQLCNSEPTKTLSDCSLEPIEFKSAQLTKHEEHAGLGSGYTFATSVDGTEISTGNKHALNK